MKGFALVLLCVVAAVQGRSTAVQSPGRSLAAVGENPWLVHLRIAVGTSGFLNTCAGTLIDNRWAITTGGCLLDARFVWVRYGVVTVINPELVTETSTVIVHNQYDPATNNHNLGLVSINRYVPTTSNIRPVPLATLTSNNPGSPNFCAFGSNEAGGAGDRLNCFEVDLAYNPVTIWATSEYGQTTVHDLGAPLVNDDDELYGVLITPGGQPTESGTTGAGVFLIVAGYDGWIDIETRRFAL